MSQEKLSQRHDPEDRGYTPASPVKRTLAWIALAYVLIVPGPDHLLLFQRIPCWATWAPCSRSPASSAWGPWPW